MKFIFVSFFFPILNFLGAKKGLNNNQFSTNCSDSSTDNVFQHIEHVYQISIRLSVIFSFYDPHRDEKANFRKSHLNPGIIFLPIQDTFDIKIELKSQYFGNAVSL